MRRLPTLLQQLELVLFLRLTFYWGHELKFRIRRSNTRHLPANLNIVLLEWKTKSFYFEMITSLTKVQCCTVFSMTLRFQVLSFTISAHLLSCPLSLVPLSFTSQWTRCYPHVSQSQLSLRLGFSAELNCATVHSSRNFCTCVHCRVHCTAEPSHHTLMYPYLENRFFSSTWLRRNILPFLEHLQTMSGGVKKMSNSSC